MLSLNTLALVILLAAVFCRQKRAQISPWPTLSLLGRDNSPSSPAAMPLPSGFASDLPLSSLRQPPNQRSQ